MPDGYGDLETAQLLTSEERAQSVVITDPSRSDNPIIFVSEEFERQTGYGPDEVLGQNCRFLQGQETDPEDIETIRRALRAKEPITIDILNYRKDGTEFWNRLRIRPLFEESGRLIFFAGAQNPIGEDEVRRGAAEDPT